MKLWRSRRDKDSDLDAEIRTHIEQAIRDRVERGDSPDDARSNVMREFGNRDARQRGNAQYVGLDIP